MVGVESQSVTICPGDDTHRQDLAHYPRSIAVVPSDRQPRVSAARCWPASATCYTICHTGRALQRHCQNGIFCRQLLTVSRAVDLLAWPEVHRQMLRRQPHLADVQRPRSADSGRSTANAGRRILAPHGLQHLYDGGCIHGVLNDAKLFWLSLRLGNQGGASLAWKAIYDANQFRKRKKLWTTGRHFRASAEPVVECPHEGAQQAHISWHV